MNSQPPHAFAAPLGDVADDARLRRRGRTALWLVLALVLGFFGLAAILEVGGAVIGSGEVTVESSVKTISHPAGGVLLALAVRDGDHVAAGQELMRFDTAVSGVGSLAASSSLFQLLARRARLEAERDGLPAIRFPADLIASADPAARAAIADERSSFVLRGRDRQGNLALLTARVTQYADQIRSIEAQIHAIDRQASLIEPELAGVRSLYAKRLVPLQRVNELERTAVQLQGSRSALTANIAEIRGRISETREQMLNLAKASRSDAATELATVDAQLNEQQLRHASADDTLSRSVIRAPQSGTIDKLAYTTIGSAVPAGQPILQIVPDRDALIVEAQVKPDDVEQLRIGQQARVTFSGLDRQATPDVAGTLTFISADLTRDQRSGAAYYRIKIRLDAGQLANAPQIVLKPGMPAQAFIQTGNRSILSFLLKPLLDQIRYAMRAG